MNARRKRILVVGGSVAILFMSLAAIVLSTGKRVLTPPAITFLGFTNASGQNTAIFSVKNPYSRPVSFFPLDPQVPVNGDWAAAGIRIPTGGGPTLYLGADGQTNFTVDVPVDGNVWRVPVLWSMEPSRFDHFRYVFRNNWNAWRENGTLLGLSIGYGVESFTNYTPEVSNPENKALTPR
jgi:hypothetical protein